MTQNNIEKLITLAQSKGLLHTRDVAKEGISREYLKIACKRRILVRLGRGLYCIPNQSVGENTSLGEVCKVAPRGVICLLSALRFHNLTTQLPSDVWLAIGQKNRRPKIETVMVRILRFSDAALNSDVEIHNIDGVEIKVFSPAKTVADCFKYRNKIGLDVSIEALRDCLRLRKATVDELVRQSRICRVEKIMKPYLEAML
jgi:predicted transcriptional regulator of viral defense system